MGSFWPSTMPPLDDVGLGAARVSFTTKGSAALESGKVSPSVLYPHMYEKEGSQLTGNLRGLEARTAAAALPPASTAAHSATHAHATAHSALHVLLAHLLDLLSPASRLLLGLALFVLLIGGKEGEKRSAYRVDSK